MLCTLHRAASYLEFTGLCCVSHLPPTILWHPLATGKMVLMVRVSNSKEKKPRVVGVTETGHNTILDHQPQVSCTKRGIISYLGREVVFSIR